MAGGVQKREVHPGNISVLNPAWATLSTSFKLYMNITFPVKPVRTPSFQHRHIRTLPRPGIPCCSRPACFCCFSHSTCHFLLYCIFHSFFALTFSDTCLPTRMRIRISVFFNCISQLSRTMPDTKWLLNRYLTECVNDFKTSNVLL